MTECYRISLRFPYVERRKVGADFSGGETTANGGMMLISNLDRHLRLIQGVTSILGERHR